jgi:hypothetical protein
MVWGCMSAAGVGNLVFIDGIMNAEVYKNILAQNLLVSADKLGLADEFHFQQDNDPKHTARIVKEFLASQPRFKVMQWPAQSPDLNPIEHLWEEVGRRLKKHMIRNAAELREKIVEEWNLITHDVTANLVASMPRRVAEVLRRKGQTTKY